MTQNPSREPIQTSQQNGVRIGISNAEDDNYLVMMIAQGDQCQFHHLSLAAARAISLELIKNVYQAEMKKNLKFSKSTTKLFFQDGYQRLQHQLRG
jgi:hypothetical protein